MATERRRQLLLAALAVALVIAVYLEWPGPARVSTPPSNQRAAGTSGVARDRAGKPSAPTPTDTTDVHLDALTAERPKPQPTERNLFRFREKRSPAPVTSGRSTAP